MEKILVKYSAVRYTEANVNNIAWNEDNINHQINVTFKYSKFTEGNFNRNSQNNVTFYYLS